MSVTALIFQLTAAQSDKKRDAAIPLPEGITQCRNISYGPYQKDSLLDVYYPDGTDQPLPTIVSIHGGGYVYGTKEIYRRYGMDMARRGFAFVNFNYRLAPKWKFPTPLFDINAVLEWVSLNHHRYHLDPDRIFLVGDSAGAQLASQYAALFTNPAYAEQFNMLLPRITIRALGLNCGMYDLQNFHMPIFRGLSRDYLGKADPRMDPRLDVLGAVTDRYPPAFISTACHDFLRQYAKPMHDYLTEKGVPSCWKCYGTEEDKTIAHVFHINIPTPEARQCNDDTAAFFREYL